MHCDENRRWPLAMLITETGFRLRTFISLEEWHLIMVMMTEGSEARRAVVVIHHWEAGSSNTFS